MRSARKHETNAAGLGQVATPIRETSERQWLADQETARKHALAQVGAKLATLRSLFATAIDQAADEVYSAMQVQGFWRGDQDNFGSKTALVHSELSEMLEADRKGIKADDKVPEYSGAEAEAADTVIRLLDMAGRYEWRLGEAIIDKMLFNLTREPKHGKAY